MTFYEKIDQIDQILSNNKQSVKGPAELKAILEQFEFNADEMAEHLLNPEDLPYGRKCAYRSKNFEVIVMNWKPGKNSNIHNHGNSFGCVYSVTGNANNVLYNENLEKITTIPLINNTIAEVPKGIFHVIENKNDDYAISLHFYAPPMCGMKVIDSENKTKSYFVKNEVGAWDPKPEEVL